MRRQLLLTSALVAGIAGYAGTASAAFTPGLQAACPTPALPTPAYTVKGGGSTLAANLYNRTASGIASSTDVGAPFGAAGVPAAEQAFGCGTNWPGTTSTSNPGEMLFGADGSGKGQQAMVTQDWSVHTGNSTDAFTVTHYGASDAYLSASQLTCWNTGSVTDCAAAGYTVSAGHSAPSATGGPLIQIPSFGTAVVIAYTNQYKSGTLGAIQVDDNDICGIFSGKITDWSGIERTPGGSAPKGLGGQIQIVYREDGSGTSFLFTQHLSKVCNSTNSAAGVTFTATKYFADAFNGVSGYTGTFTGSNHTINSSPAGTSFVFGSGSTGVADVLIGGTTYVGYITPDYTNIAPTALPHYIKVANLTGVSANDTSVDPAQSPYQFINYAKVYNQHSQKYYRPNPGGANKGLLNPNTTDFSPGFPTSKVNAQNPLQWVPQVADPLDGYPIVGYTTLLFASCYSDHNVQNYVVNYLKQLYAATNKVNLTAEGFVSVPSGYATTIRNVFVLGKSPYAINIGNANMCNGSHLSGTYSGL
jgi:ABC-type phosphate transport system substrate-binding protein